MIMDSGMDKKGKKDEKPAVRRRFRGLKIAAGTVAALWILLLAVMQVVLNSSFLMSMAGKYIPQYVDADVHIGNIKASVFKSFPNLNLEVSGLTVTYPHDRYAEYDSVGVYGMLRGAGRSDEADTLASVRSMALSVNYMSALFGRIHVHEVSMDRPHLFAHSYGDGVANWNVLRTQASSGQEDVEDTTSSELPPIIVNRVCMTGRPRIVYTDCADTIFAAIALKQMHFHGKLTTESASGNRLGLELDSLFISGRLPADTLAVAMDHFDIREQRGKIMAFDAGAKAFAGMSEYGRVIVPVEMKGRVRFPKESVPSVEMPEFEAKVASVSMTGNGTARYYGDSTYVRAEVSVDKCRVEDIIRDFGKNFMPDALNLKTDAELTLTALCDGYYNPGRNSLPELIAELVVPRASVGYPGIPDGSIEADINASTDSGGKLDIDIDGLCLNFGGLDFDATGTVSDVMGEDPLFDVEGLAYASVDKMMAFVPDTSGYHASGDIDAVLTGKIRMSQMTPYNFYRANLDGYVRSRNLIVSSDKDTLYAWIGSPEIGISTVANKVDGTIPKGTKVLALTAKVDSLYATYGSDMAVRGSGVRFEAQNAAKVGKGEDAGHHPIVGQLSLGRLFMSGADSLFAGVTGSVNTFDFSQVARGKIMEPRMSVVSENAGVFAREGVNRYGFRNAKISASAVMSTFENAQKRRFFLDSLQKVYPGVPRDSLFRKMLNARMAGKDVPDFIKEKDFRKSDIDITLNETLVKYVKEWKMKGGLDIREGIVITPYFPLKNVIEDVRCTIDNDAVNLANVTVRPGGSDISAKGVLSGLQRAMLGYGPLKLDLKITSDKMDANELLTAYSAGVKFGGESTSLANDSTMDDSEYLAAVYAAHDAAAADSSYALLVIPANLLANVSLQANEIDYSDLKISWLASDMTMKERCVQLTNTLATSNMGDIFFEGFYSTRTKKDIRAGFDLNLADITADKVVQLFPAVDSIMPMLTSFKGMLNCEMAATTALDTNMNFITPSMNGIMKISGRNVTLEESAAFRKLARLLMFKNKKTGELADMSVSGLISDNRLEIFPFVLKIDRYTLAMSGLQNFDQTFKYHVSVLKSPIPFRFGINIFGNFDDWKYRIGKAQYKNTNVPVFTAQIDTMQMNLVNSIHNIFAKGVDLAVRQNEAMRSDIDSKKVAMGFNPDAQMDSLDSGQASMLDSLQTAYDNPVDSVLNARIDSLQVISSGADLQAADGTGGSVLKQAASSEDRKAERKRRKEDRKAARRGDAAAVADDDDIKG